jgi:hypothetical protein
VVVAAGVDEVVFESGVVEGCVGAAVESSVEVAGSEVCVARVDFGAVGVGVGVCDGGFDFPALFFKSAGTLTTLQSPRASLFTSAFASASEQWADRRQNST